MRIDNCFETLKLTNKKALITFLTAGDPNYDLSLELIKSLPEAGADIIEIGMPFSDPMADGPAIQASSLRAINSGHKMEKTFEMIESFRKDNSRTPIILMGYFNPIYNYGVDSFIKKIIDIEVDGGIKANWTISQCCAAGANCFIAGSGMFAYPTLKEGCEDLRKTNPHITVPGGKKREGVCSF